MIEGVVSRSGLPLVVLEIAGRDWSAMVDTGFNGDVELPVALATRLSPRYIGRIRSGLAGGVTIAEDQFEMTIPFDGELIAVTGTFVDTPEILIGTRLLRKHRLTVDFVAATVQIERIISG